MAITARFVADFSSFQAAVAGAEAKLVDFSKGADRAGGALNRMVDGFSGRKMIQDAALMERAIAEIGGVSKLTEAEMRKVNATIQEAVNKFKALGQVAPPGMQQLAEATKGANQSTSLLTLGIGKLAAGFTAAKVIGFAADLFQAAGRLQDLHERTDISVEALQRFKIIAEQSGSSIDAVATAVFQMGRRLAGGDESAAQAIAELGLNFQSLRSQRPEDAFNTIGQALGQMTDSFKVGELGSAIFGRSVAELIPTFKHLGEETGSYLTLSARQVSALDAAGDAFVRVKNSMVPATVKLLDFALGISRFLDAWESLKGTLPTPVFRTLEKDIQASAQAVKDRAAQVLTGAAVDAKARQAIFELDAAIAVKNRRMSEAKAAADRVTEANQKFRDSVVNLTSSANGAAQGFGAFGRLMPDLSAQTLLFADRTEVLASALDATKDEVEALQREGRFLSAALADAGMTIGTLPTVTSQWGDAIRDLPLEDVVGGLEQWDDEIEELASDLARFSQIAGDSFGGVIKDIAEIAAAWDMAADALADYAKAQEEGSRTGQGLALLEGATAVGAATRGGGVKGVLGGAATGAKMGSAFGPWGTVVGAGVGALVGWARTAGPSKDELAARELVGDVNERLEKMISASGRAEAAGAAWKESVISAREAYILTGRTAEQAMRDVGAMWDSTREGSAAAAKAAQTVNEILDQAAKLSTDRAAAEKAAAETIANASSARMAKFQSDLDVLIAKRDDLIKRVEKEAPERVMGVIEKQARSELKALDSQISEQRGVMEKAAKEMANDVERAFAGLKIHVPIVWDVPSLPGGRREAPEPGDIPGFAGGTGGRYLNFGAGTLAMLHGRERIMPEGEAAGGGGVAVIHNYVMLDGREISRSTDRVTMNDLRLQKRLNVAA